jgi:hypothetical protein
MNDLIERMNETHPPAASEVSHSLALSPPRKRARMSPLTRLSP